MRLHMWPRTSFASQKLETVTHPPTPFSVHLLVDLSQQLLRTMTQGGTAAAANGNTNNNHDDLRGRAGIAPIKAE